MKTEKEIKKQIKEELGGDDAVTSRLKHALFDGVDEGYCLGCGEPHEGAVEPDARGYKCYNCGEKKVSSITEIFMYDL